MTQQIVDVLIIGAGLSGIGAACHLTRECPGKRYLILEGRQAIGGTWDLFRYPGIRSDSDMYTLGYSFRPWTDDKAIADGPSILRYINETADEYQVRPNIRFGQRVVKADFHSDEALWYLHTRTDEGQEAVFKARFVINCTGYYRYDAGYTPEFPGRERFQGDFIHPQLWPEGYDYRGKKVVVIGSGATAVTLVPAMADDAAHVTMLQRSPSYVATVPEKDFISIQLRRFLPEKLVYRLARARNVGLQMGVFQLSKRQPRLMRKLLLKQVAMQVGSDFDLSHFSPRYNPWDERLCAVPNGDLFKTLKKKQASVVTGQIETFTEHGIRLTSGEELEADVIISATGLQIQLLGGAELYVDGRPYDVSQAVSYKSIMFSDLPNAAMIFGYTNSSWTLKADLSCEYLCRLLTLMDRKGADIVTPRAPANLETRPFLDMSSGYVQRALGMLPRQGTRSPWRTHQNYALDMAILRLSRLDDGNLEFSNAAPVQRPQSGDGAAEHTPPVETASPGKTTRRRKASASDETTAAPAAKRSRKPRTRTDDKPATA